MARRSTGARTRDPSYLAPRLPSLPHGPHLAFSRAFLLSFLVIDYRTIISTTAHSEITYDLLYAITITLLVARCAVTGLERLFLLQSFVRTAIDGVPAYQLA
ncbi:hypothetical protein R3P38DRAFT_3195435 [Favolaschia claudopus]|uniref:Uncharacterized protein n=1 Tax=Favolaschia claudopus TaxID=2862362 RepID=A0AAW0BC35_9AGAR